MGIEVETEVQEGDLLADFEVLEAGRYHFGIDSQDDTKPSKAGLPMSSLSLKVLEGPSANGSARFWVPIVTREQVAEAEASGDSKQYRSLRFQFSNMLKLLAAVGLYDLGGALKFNTDDLVGKEFDADVTVEDYKKEDGSDAQRNQIKVILEAGAEATAPEGTDAAAGETEEQKAEREATEAAEAEAAAAEAAAAEAAAEAAAKPKPGLKKPLVKPPLKKPAPAPAKAPVKAPAKAPAKHSFGRR